MPSASNAQRTHRAAALPRAPRGHVTRGKTAANRLRRIDVLTALYDPWLLRRQDGPWAEAWVVDLGYGASAATTLETAARLRRLNGSLRIMGVEIDRARVEAALPFADERTAFRHGGFALPLESPGGRPETVRLVRAMNVLRQYEAAEVAAAHAALVGQLLPGGLLIEGTSDPTGRHWVVNVLRRPADGAASPPDGAAAPQARTPSPLPQTAGPAREALVFGTNFADGFDPARFKAVLPKDVIHRVVPGEPIHAFFEAWRSAWRDAAPAGVWGPRFQFRHAAIGLSRRGHAIDLRRAMLDRGLLVWRPA